MAQTDTGYTPPEMLSDIDDGAIHARMLSSLPEDIDTTEGGFAYDFTMPAAIEKADMMVMLNEMVQINFAKWSYGIWLDEHALMAGLSRREAVKAAGVLTLTGESGLSIAAGTRFASASEGEAGAVLFESTQSASIDREGFLSLPVQAVEGGISGNVPARAISLLADEVNGVTSVINEHKMTGGADEESDEELRARILERDTGIDASYAGSVSDYLRWAKEVPGVSDAKVIPEWDGPGTVKVIVAGGDETLPERVLEYICSPTDETARKSPIGAKVTVAAPVSKVIAVSAAVTLSPDAVLEEIRAGFYDALAAYLPEAAKDGEVRISRVGMLLSALEGVADYANLELNGAQINILIGPDEYPAVGEVVLNG